MNLSVVRKNFPVTKKWNYLNHGIISPLPKPVREAMDKFNSERETNGGLSSTKWSEEIEASRDTIARLIYSSGEQVAFFLNTSDALNYVADMLPLSSGEEVLVSDLEFPSNAFPWLKLRRKGVRVNWARSHDGILIPEDIERTMSDRTRVIAISHVCFYNGFRVDLEEIAEIARNRGVILVVDAMQSIGALKIDVRKLDIDFLASSGYKWLLAPFGVALLHCRKDWIAKSDPPRIGWSSIRNAQSKQIEIEEFEFADTARRFEVGQPNLEGIFGLKAAAEFLLQIKPETVERRVLYLTRRIRDGLSSHNGFDILSPEEGISGITLFRIRGKEPAEVVNVLRRKRIVVFAQRWKDGIGVKVSPHFYNTDHEIDGFLDAARSLV